MNLSDDDRLGTAVQPGALRSRRVRKRETHLAVGPTPPPSMAGQVYDTYVAALQHDIADVPADATRLGVVRRPTPWFWGQVDENVPALAPPADLLDETKARQEALEAEGADDADAHNRAIDDVDFEARYLAYLDDSAEAAAAIADLHDRIDDGEDVALVCYENTEEKRCHRTLLRERLVSDRG